MKWLRLRKLGRAGNGAPRFTPVPTLEDDPMYNSDFNWIIAAGAEILLAGVVMANLLVLYGVLCAYLG